MALSGMLLLSGCGSSNNDAAQQQDTTKAADDGKWKSIVALGISFEVPSDMEFDEELESDTACVLQGDNRNIMVDVMDGSPDLTGEYNVADVDGGTVYLGKTGEFVTNVVVDTGTQTYYIVYNNFLKEDADEALERFVQTVRL